MLTKLKSYDEEDDYKELCDTINDLTEIQEMNIELNKYIITQQHILENNEMQLQNANIQIKETNNTLYQTEKLQQSIISKKKTLLVVGVTAITIPAFVIAGPKIALITGIGSIICGFASLV